MTKNVNTTKYQAAHGKQPRGYGRWAFGDKAGSKVVFIGGLYSEAKCQAIAWAAQNLENDETLYVLS